MGCRAIVTLNQMSNKKTSKKKEEEKQLELERALEEEQREQERKQKEQKLKQLAAKSEPLLSYGLLDSYQFFLGQLASAGIPQGNVYQFAAQAVLKFEKQKNRKLQALKEVEEINEEAVKEVSQSKQKTSKTRVQRQIKPQVLPFKGELSPSELDILSKR